MIKARVLLGLAGLISIIVFVTCKFGADVAIAASNPVLALAFTTGLLISPFTFSSSVVMFVFSFGDVKETSDGRLAYDPQNHYWQWVKGSNKDMSLSLCGAFWHTVIKLLYLLGFGLLGFLVVKVIITVFRTGLPSLSREQYIMAAQVVAFTALGLSGTILYHRNRQMDKSTIAPIIMMVGAMVIAVCLIVQIIGIVKTLFIIGGAILIIVGMVLVMIAISKLFSLDNMFIRYLKAFKEENCPLLVESSLVVASEVEPQTEK